MPNLNESRRLRLNGWTLLEICIVCSIVALLATITGLAVAPTMRRKAVESQVAQSLHQNLVAIAVYMGDNDGGYPNFMRSLPPGTPVAVANWQRLKGDPWYFHAGEGKGDFYLTYHMLARASEADHPQAFKFNPSQDYLVRSPLRRHLGSHKEQVFGRCDMAPITLTGPYVVALVGYEDGHARWADIMDPWLDLNTACLSEGFR